MILKYLGGKLLVSGSASISFVPRRLLSDPGLFHNMVLEVSVFGSTA
jgi:hypothetical protein